MQNPASPLYSRIYALVRRIPPGRVTAYGLIARQDGCTARTVGFAMTALRDCHDVPWQRVINSQGKVSPRRNGDDDLIQRLLLEAEGVQFDAVGGSISSATAGRLAGAKAPTGNTGRDDSFT